MFESRTASEQTSSKFHSVKRCPTKEVHNREKDSQRKCVEHHLCHPSSHLLSQRKDSDSEITEFCPRTEEANNTSGDGDSSEDSFPSLPFSRRLGPQSPHCVLRGRHNGALVRLIMSGMHVKTWSLKPLFVAFWQSRGADLHPEDSVMVFWSFDEMVRLHSYTSYRAIVRLFWATSGHVISDWMCRHEGRAGWPSCDLGHRANHPQRAPM